MLGVARGFVPKSMVAGGLWLLVTGLPSSLLLDPPQVRAMAPKPQPEQKPDQKKEEAPPADATALEILKRTRWTGDLDGMRARRIVRILVPYSKTFYFLDGVQQRGTAYELGKELEIFLNKKFKTGKLLIHAVFVPVPRDELIQGLVEGRGDIAAGGLTITPERQQIVDASTPLMTNVSAVIVTGPSAPSLAKLEDLAGQEVYVRAASSYHENLRRLNDKLREAGKPEVVLKPADGNLEDEDILEMVNAGLVGITVVVEPLANFWKGVFPDITVRTDLVIDTGGNIAYAIRKNSPRLKAVLDEFVAGHKEGTEFGNVILRRYLRDNRWVKSAAAQEERKKFAAIAGLFKKYAEQYDFDYLLLAAQAYQESRLEQKLRSPAGAVGVMQIKPSTAAGAPINIKDVERIENNIHAGVKYLRFVMDEYYKDEPMTRINKELFAIASYNAGPARIAGLRKKAAAEGLDPNKWFKNVELIAAREIGQETIQYVANILKYYLAYQMITEQAGARKKAVESAKPKPRDDAAQ